MQLKVVLVVVHIEVDFVVSLILVDVLMPWVVMHIQLRMWMRMRMQLQAVEHLDCWWRLVVDRAKSRFHYPGMVYQSRTLGLLCLLKREVKKKVKNLISQYSDEISESIKMFLHQCLTSREFSSNHRGNQ